jgi:hypothetical protein
MAKRKIYEVWNFGCTRLIPYKKDSIFLQADWGFETEDIQLVSVLKAIPYVNVKFKRTETVAESPPKNKEVALNKSKTTKPTTKTGASSATQSKKKKDEIIQKMKEVTSNG